MRRKNRELTPFGLASLDLFASALGAFILISIVIFPLIGNPTEMPPEPTPVTFAMDLTEIETAAEPASCPVCPTLPAVPEPVACPTVLAPSANLVAPECPVCPEPVQLECPAAEPVRVIAPASDFQLPHLDLIIALDVTGSMGRQVEALKAEVGQLSVLMSRLAPSFGVGMVAFGDRYWDEPVTSFPLRDISGPTQARQAFRGFVNGLSVQMGVGDGANPDAPEAVLQALRTAASMTWRPQSQQRVIVLVTDSPAYPEEAEQVIAAAGMIGRAGGQYVSTVYINSQGVVDSAVEAFLQQVAEAAGGQFIRDVGGSLTVNLLLSLL